MTGNDCAMLVLVLSFDWLIGIVISSGISRGFAEHNASSPSQTWRVFLAWSSFLKLVFFLRYWAFFLARQQFVFGLKYILKRSLKNKETRTFIFFTCHYRKKKYFNVICIIINQSFRFKMNMTIKPNILNGEWVSIRLQMHFLDCFRYWFLKLTMEN